MMKKILFSILLVIFLTLPTKVFAEGYISVSPSSLTIKKGSSATFTITAYNAIGDAKIISNNSGIASVNTSSWETGMVGEKETKKGSIKVNGLAVGTTTIKITIDGATFDEESLTGQTKTVSINVIANPTSPSTPSQPSKPSNSNDQNSNLSKNNKLKTLTVDGHKLTKINENNYTLSVSNKVSEINIKATAEHKKATVTGTGNKKLQIGENNFKIIVTSESGEKNTINLKVTRKDGIYLEDLDEILKDANQKDIEIIIDKDTKLSNEILTKIKQSGKTIKLTYFDGKKKMIYSWTINGSSIDDIKPFSTVVSFQSDNVHEISEIANYAEGIILNFKHTGQFPTNTKIKIFVGDKYTDESLLNIYYYNKEDSDLELIKEKIKVTDGYVEFDIKHASEYFVTKATLQKNATTTSEEVANNDKTTNNKYYVLSIIELAVIMMLCIICFIIIIKYKDKISKKTMIILILCILMATSFIVTGTLLSYKQSAIPIEQKNI